MKSGQDGVTLVTSQINVNSANRRHFKRGNAQTILKKKVGDQLDLFQYFLQKTRSQVTPHLSPFSVIQISTKEIWIVLDKTKN